LIAIAGGGGVNLFNSQGNAWTADYLKITGELDVDLRSNIAAELKKRGYTPQPKPKFDKMLAEINGGHLYLAYKETSQFTHSTHAATWLYRTGGVGSAARFGEFVKPMQWILPLRMCWLAISHPADIAISRVTDGAQAGWSSHCSEKIDAIFRDLAADRQDRVH